MNNICGGIVNATEAVYKKAKSQVHPGQCNAPTGVGRRCLGGLPIIETRRVPV